MNKPPAFQFYVGDFVSGTVDMTAEQVGAYIRLLCYQWSKGSIPQNKATVDLIAGCNVCQDVMDKFPNLKNIRLEQEREKQLAYREKQASKASARWKLGNAAAYSSALPVHMPEACSSSSSSSSIIDERESKADFPEIPPISRKDLDALASVRGISPECVEWFWNTHDARNWIDAKGQPVRKVEPLLLNAWTKWRASQKPKQPEPKQLREVIEVKSL